MIGRTFVVILLSTSVLCSLSDSKSAEDILAQVDGEIIDVGYLKSYLSSRPGVAYSQVTGKTVEQRLEELIAGEVLCKEAVRIGLDRKPEIRLQIQQILAQNLLEEKINMPVREQKISDQELRAYYNAHADEFQRPAQVRLADIFISVEPAADSHERMQKKAKAEKILAEVLAHQGERLGFGKRILKYSDTPEEYPRGNTGFFDLQGKPIGLDSNLAREAFKLKKSGQICEQVVEAADGCHVIMLAARREPINQPFEKVKERLRLRLYRERIALQQAEYIESLRQKSKIKIHRDVFDQFVKTQEAKAGTINAKGRDAFPAFPNDTNLTTQKARGPR